MAGFGESMVEQAALAWLEAIGWRIAHGPDIAPDMPAAVRHDYGEVVLAQRLRDPLARLNPALHRLLVNGVTVEYRTREGEVRGTQARVIDFDEPAGNDWLAVNQ